MVGQCQAHKRVKVILGKGNNMRGKQKSKLRDHLEFSQSSLDFQRQHRVGSISVLAMLCFLHSGESYGFSFYCRYNN